jgi:Trk K+ transport system NAD-binding subunit
LSCGLGDVGLRTVEQLHNAGARVELGARIRTIAIGRRDSGGELDYPPRRDTRLLAGDDAYLAGPYDELQRVLRREREDTAL